MRLSAPIHRLKRVARDHARQAAIPLHAALDRVAGNEGYASWSLLASKHNQYSIDAAELLQVLWPGELILLAARPQQGKTRFALHLAIEAIAAGREAHFFSLDYTQRDVTAQLATLPADLVQYAGKLRTDCSDTISADYMTARLAAAPQGSFIAVDYLQLLDQKRSHPALQQQIETLAAFARSHGHVFAFVCQIDRSFDASDNDVPGLSDIRLPNPLDLTLFTRAVFLHGGQVRLANLRS